MNSFLRNVAAGLSGRESLVKDTLTNQLSTSVKEIQLDLANRQDKSEPFETDDVTSSLCIVLEAIFIHGLKDTFLNRVTQAIGASDGDQRPEPAFWAPILVFSHREIIDQVNDLFLISNDVGRSRAWIRLALNDGLLSSYLGSMKRDSRALTEYYQSKAFLRDSELLDVAQRLVQGIDNYPFALACNSSLLNVWTNQPLLLAGLWTPPFGCPVNPAIDVVNMLVAEEESLLETHKGSPSTASLNMLSFNEDEALKLILASPSVPTSASSEAPATATTDCTGSDTLPAAAPTDIPSLQGDQNDPSSSLGNSLTGRLGWSSSFEQLDVPPTLAHPQDLTVAAAAMQITTPTELQSYHSLVESYNLLFGSCVKTPDVRDFLQRYEGFGRTMLEPGSSCDTDDLLTGLGYEVIPSNLTSLFDMPDFGVWVQQLGKLPLECGLDDQNFACISCGHPIGVNMCPANVCSFSGHSYCSECHVGDEWIIPARVIYNWDYRLYPVCIKSAAFLEEIQHHPLIDLKVFNPRLYLVISEMSQLQALRIQLNLLRAYLFTCREPIIEELQKRVWPREYLYEHVHLYSVADLQQIPSGALAQLLTRVVKFARDHVLTCWLCSQKGFICEVCNNTKVIYPFDTDFNYRCGECSAVFHMGCLDSTKPCPKCQRKQKREEMFEK